MKESFAEIFKEGGKSNSLGRSKEVLAEVLNNKQLTNELYDCISNQDAWVRMRAIDTFEKVCRENPDWALPYTEDMLARLSKSDQPSIQWHLAQLFGYIELTATQTSQATQWLSGLLNTNDVDWIVAANSMDTLAYFSRTGSFSKAELIRLLKIQKHHKSNAVKKRADKLLTEFS